MRSTLCLHVRIGGKDQRIERRSVVAQGTADFEMIRIND